MTVNSGLSAAARAKPPAQAPLQRRHSVPVAVPAGNVANGSAVGKILLPPLAPAPSQDASASVAQYSHSMRPDTILGCHWSWWRLARLSMVRSPQVALRLFFKKATPLLVWI
jgi:hypothetical protein